MNRSERDRLIEQYLSGEMSSVKEEEFFIQVALNEEMRQELKAHRTIENAVRKERETESPQHSALRQKVASFIVLHPAPAALTGELAGGGASAGTAVVAGGLGQGWWWVATAIVLAIVAGAILLRTGDTPSIPVPAAVVGSDHTVPDEAFARRTLPTLVGGATAVADLPSGSGGENRVRTAPARRSAGVEPSGTTTRNALRKNAINPNNTVQPTVRPVEKRRSGDSVPVKIKVRMSPLP